jgi:hypothetical protein
MCCCVWMGHVEQASFKPLGITIAVAKDRAIESLMQVGSTKGSLIYCSTRVSGHEFFKPWSDKCDMWNLLGGRLVIHLSSTVLKRVTLHL